MPGRGTPPSFTPAGTYNGDPFTLAATSGGGATGSSPWVGTGDYHTLRLWLSNVAFTGGTAPTVTATVETSPDGTTNIVAIGAFAATAAGATARRVVTGLDRFTRVSWTTTGAPTGVSFTASGEAV